VILALLLGAAPADLAPGAPELLEAEARLRALLATSEAVGAATARLQVAWTAAPAPKKAPCADEARLEVGWRVERFGAAWREAAQAVRAQADRVRRLRSAPTVSPLVDSTWGRALDALQADAEREARAFVEASAWQVQYVRPVLGACVVPPPRPLPGIPMLSTPVRGVDRAPVAVLALGDGYVCPGGARADDAVVLVEGGEACWSASETCGCVARPVEPGAVLGPEP
jgi:hypothetical protein